MRNLICIFLISIPAFACAQTRMLHAPGAHEVGGAIGFADYHGDMGHVLSPALSELAFHGYYRRNVSKAVSFRANAEVVRIKGNSSESRDEYKNNLGRSFSAFLIGGSLLLEYHFLDFRFEKVRRFSPYLVMGAGFFNYNPQETASDLVPGGVEPVLPFGLGYKRTLGRTNTWCLNFEFLAHKTFTDHLDNTTEQTNFRPQTGEGQSTDWYSTFTVGVSYNFQSVKCPTEFIY